MSENNHSEELVKHLRAELEEARRQAAEARTDHRGKLKDALKQVEELRGKLDLSSKEAEKLSKKLESTPKELQGEVDRLKGELRTRDHRSKFNDLAKEAKVRAEALDDLWNLSGYKAEADDIDEKAISEAIAKTVEARSYLIESEPVQVIHQPAPGGGKGQSANVTGFVMTSAQSRDGKFLQANRDAIQAAAKSGTLKTL